MVSFSFYDHTKTKNNKLLTVSINTLTENVSVSLTRALLFASTKFRLFRKFFCSIFVVQVLVSHVIFPVNLNPNN